MMNLFGENRYGQTRTWPYYAIGAIAFVVLLTWFSITMDRYEGEIYAKCDPRIETCKDADRRERCDGLNLVIREGYNRDSTMTVSPNSPKCMLGDTER